MNFPTRKSTNKIFKREASALRDVLCAQEEQQHFGRARTTSFRQNNIISATRVAASSRG
jgi:hypothetical protein